jgi:hypothetical protein
MCRATQTGSVPRPVVPYQGPATWWRLGEKEPMTTQCCLCAQALEGASLETPGTVIGTPLTGLGVQVRAGGSCTPPRLAPSTWSASTPRAPVRHVQEVRKPGDGADYIAGRPWIDSRLAGQTKLDIVALGRVARAPTEN